MFIVKKMRRENKQIKKALKTILIFTFIFSWIFSGWPQVWKNPKFPPEIKKVLAADTGVKTAGTATNISWTSGWDTASLSGDDTSIAIYSSVGTAVGVLSDFSFNVPTDAQSIDGIKVEIEAQEGHINCNAYLNTYLSWDGGSNYTAAYRSPDGTDELPIGSTLFTEGGVADTWGRTWSVSEFSDANFEVKIEGTNARSGKNVEIDYVWVTVYYTPSATLPVASLVSIDSDAASVTLTENITTEVVCEATVEDASGYADITSVEARFYETTQGAAGTADENYRYILTGATAVYCSGSGISGTCSFTFDAQFFANPAGWTCQVTPSDSGGSGTADSDAITINTTLALNISGNIEYGDMGLGTNSGTSPKTVVVTNTGNAIMDPQVSSAAAMSCASGTIPIANQEYSNTTFTYGSGTDLSSIPATLNLTLPKPTSTTPVTDNSYWGIGIPGTGVGGSCTGSNTFTAIAGS